MWFSTCWNATAQIIGVPGTLNWLTYLLRLVNPHPTHSVGSSTTPTYGCSPCWCLVHHKITVGPAILSPSREALRVSFRIWPRGRIRRTSQGSRSRLIITVYRSCLYIYKHVHIHMYVSLERHENGNIHQWTTDIVYAYWNQIVERLLAWL